jgi:probable HAF family extracellular repeat protein
MQNPLGRRLALALVFLPLLVGFAAPESPPTVPNLRFTVTDLGTLGGSYSEAFGINASGQVVGDAATSTGSSHAFLYSGGVMFDLNLPGTSATARAINASGQIVGYYYDGSYQAYLDTNGQITDLGNLGALYSAGYAVNAGAKACGSSMTSSNDEHAFLWSAGTMTDINPLGGSYSSAHGINRTGQVVGYGYLPNGAFHAFVRRGGVVTDLGTLGGSYSQADAINDAGKVVGQAYLAGNAKAHAFLWNGSGPLKDLGQLGGSYSQALALNSAASQIVGRASVPDPYYIVYHAFLYTNGRMQDLNTLIPAGSGWTLSEAAGINDAGQIVGSGTKNGQLRAFLLNPR